MKWLPGGWQRADRSDSPRRTGRQRRADPQQQTAMERRTVPHGPRGTVHYPEQEQATQAFSPETRSGGPGRTSLSERTRDVDVSASSFRMLLVGGGLSGFFTVVCAAIIASKGSSTGMWLWQLLSGVVFFWFVTAARGMLNSRGFLVDSSGFYARTQGDVFGVPWNEVKAIGIGTLPWIQHNRPVNPQRRKALELFPSDAGFAARHPELDRWRVDEPAPMQGLPHMRYRFHLPPFTRLPRTLEAAVQSVDATKWIGNYHRELPAAGAR